MSLVLVTGGSGFIAEHTIIQLLAQDHQVRATVRNLAREGEVRAALVQGGAPSSSGLSFFAADLEKDAGWAEAVQGCDFVLHLASPFPSSPPKDENELIVPAREGALRVLRAARDAGVKRVVLTSSFAAIGYGHKNQIRTFDEKDWTQVDGDGVVAYAKSKTIAERAAWDFMTAEGGALELSVINPVGVFGPVLGADYSSSILIVQRLMDGAIPGCPQLDFGLVDVRDVADLHVRAMTHPAAKGERFLCVAGDFLPFVEIARILKRRMGTAAKRVPTRQLPNWAVRLVAIFDPAAKLITGELGQHKNATSQKARDVLGWTPRSAEESLVATAQSLLDLGLLKESARKAA